MRGPRPLPTRPSARPADPIRPRRRRLKVLLVLAGVAAFAGWFAFRTFFFDPLERSFGRFETCVPRTVDFFVRKTDLARDFDAFPRPRFWDDLEASPAWQAFVESPDFAALDGRHGLKSKLAEVEAGLARIPQLDVMRDLLGREVAVAGHFNGADLSKASVAVYARVSWRVKFALSALPYGWIRSRVAPDLRVRQGEGKTLVLEGVAGGRDLHVARDRDLVVASTDPALVKAADELITKRGEDSLGLAPKYHDGIVARRAAAQENADELEVYLDLLSLSQALGKTFTWPRDSGGFVERLGLAFFSAATVREVAEVTRFAEGVELRGRLDLNADLLSPTAKKLYAMPALDFERDVLFAGTGLASMAPRKVFLLSLLKGDAGEVARAAFRALTREQQRLIDERFKGTGKYADTTAFLEEFAGTVRDRVGLMMRRNDYAKIAGPVESGGDPPNDGVPAPCWTLVFWMKNREKVNELVDFFITQRPRFGVEKTFTIDVTGGHKAWEFHSPLVTGTGEIAVLKAGELLFVGNSWKFLKEILDAWVAPAPGRRLSDEPEFDAVTRGLGSAMNLFLFANGRLVAEHLRELVPHRVERELVPDYETERPKAKARIVAEKYPQYSGKPLPKEVVDEVERLVDAEMDRYSVSHRGAEEPKLRRKYLDQLLWADAVPSAAILVGTEPRRLDVAAKVRIRFR